jgi:DNA-binding transcriptional MerR regulator
LKIFIPDKLYFKIGEVAKIADVPTHVLRYWESEFPAIRPKRTKSKQRLYRKKDVELILQIQSLLHGQGYTIAGARNFLESDKKIITPVQENKSPGAHISIQISTIKHELKELQQLLTRKKE